MRLLYSSNAPWAATGYGVQGKSLLPRLAKLPQFGGRENIAIFAWYGLQGGVHVVDGFRVYPAGTDPYGNDIIRAHVQHFQADVVISLIDVWVMKGTAEKIAPARWLPWLPIDHDPVPEVVLESLQGAYMPLTYSKWGHKLLRAVGVENMYIPHGIETDVFRLLTEEEQANVRDFRRRLLGGEDCEHLTVMVAANKGFPDRKAFQVQLRAWAQFAKDKPHARLYLHTEPTTIYGGLDLAKLCKRLDIEDKVYFPDRYLNFLGLPAEYLRWVYNAADVLLASTMSEGFGLPIIEAQACGVPVVVTDFSAMPELVRWGFKVPPKDLFWTQLNSWQAWPDVDGIQEALESLHQLWLDNGRQLPRSMRESASQRIHAEFSWDKIVEEHWGKLFAEIDGNTLDLQRPTKMVSRNGNRAIPVGIQ